MSTAGLNRLFSTMMRYRRLGSTDMDLSIIGMGGSGYGNVYGKFSEDEAIRGVHYALDKGINYFDTAYWYGQGKSESFLGKALSGVPRQRFYIGTKIGRYERDVGRMFDFTAERVRLSALESLKRLQLDYVDLLQIHDVEFAPSVDIIVNETLPALHELKKMGVCRYIGITGYPLGVLREVVERSTVKIDSVLSYCRLTLNDSTLADQFEWFRSRHVPLINASAVGMGLLTGSGLQSWHPAGRDIQIACGEAIKYCDGEGVDITRLAVNYTTSFEEVATTLISMMDPAFVDKNMEAALHPLTDKEREVQETILERFFRPLEVQHWEGGEVIDYWKEMKQIGAQKTGALTNGAHVTNGVQNGTRH